MGFGNNCFSYTLFLYLDQLPTEKLYFYASEIHSLDS